MADSDILPINFSLSDRARSQIEVMRAEFDAHFAADPSIAVVFGWGFFYFDSGERGQNVVVGFYNRSQLSQIAHGIQDAFGMKVVFFTLPEYHVYFAGKVLDYTTERGFFLRES